MLSLNVATISLIFIAASLSISMPSAAQDASESRLVIVRADEAFVPLGFDDNDETVVVIDGYLPNSCHRVVRPEVKQNSETGEIFIMQLARRFDIPCLDIPVPFTTEVRLGVLRKGLYKLQVHGVGTKGLQILQAHTVAPDDFLYGPVESARVEFDETKQAYVATVEGRLTNSCMGLQEIRVLNSGKALVILPIMEMKEMQAESDCQATEVPFSWKAELPSNLQSGRHLLHVRSLNGRAVNAVFSVRRSL